ncbi:hypothetical protein XF24_00913 [candidate division SR1 bacterium Aalborg_AAW-1]|nr:hypothetical protein XF24_00913 [candidate division SR1 bacterium Aalborg_AAW-1]
MNNTTDKTTDETIAFINKPPVSLDESHLQILSCTSGALFEAIKMKKLTQGETDVNTNLPKLTTEQHEKLENILTAK